MRIFLLFLTLTGMVATPALGQDAAPVQSTASTPDFFGIWNHPSFPWYERPASGPGPVTNRSRVGAVVARGEVKLGFQQISELLPVSGIDFVGPLPADIQEITVFSAGIATTAKAPDAAKALIKFLSAPEAAPLIKRTGMEPAVAFGCRPRLLPCGGPKGVQTCSAYLESRR